MNLAHASCSLALLALALEPVLAQPDGTRIWVADPMDKVLADVAPPGSAPDAIEISGARGEVETAQLAVVSAEAAEVRVSVSELTGPAQALPASTVETGFVGYVPIKANTVGTPPEELIATAPCEIPDPIFPGSTRTLEAGRAQPIWLTVRVPRDAAEGTYEGTVTVTVDDAESVVPLRLTVYGFELPAERHLLYTNWCNPVRIAEMHGVEMWSEEFWAMFERYLDIMADHRQNILWVSPGYIEITEDEAGFHFDYTRFDRWIETCERHGVCDRIEVQQLGSFGPDGWTGDRIVLGSREVRDRISGETRTVPPEEYLPDFLAALEAHLRERGWLEKTMVHIADEPSQPNAVSWSEQAAFVREHAPGLRTIDAIEGPHFEGLDVWVPKLSHLRSWYPRYERARADGAEMWFYTCCHPTGLYPNRFLDFSLLKTRILHWYNWRYDLPGYLHWGLNFWPADPYTEVTYSGLPPGDCFIVYPGPDGPIDSIRWDALRDGIEDYEYLWVLRDRTAGVLAALDSELVGPGERADEIARSVVRDFVDYAHTSDELRAARARVAAEIEALGRGPALVVATDPPTWEPLVPGPIAVNVRGVVEPGTEVTVNEKDAPVNARGEFEVHVFPSEADPEVVVVATREGATKEVRRRWTVQRER